MGSWDYKSFGNDDACDWVYELEKSEGDSLLLLTLKSITEEPENLHEPGPCNRAIAAAEVVAACKGRPADELPVEIQDWVLNNFLTNVDNLAEIAVDALTLIKNSSDLKDLWEESDWYSDWLDDINSLIKKLSH